jgi:tyrosine-protein kinase Etk/Wzc
VESNHPIESNAPESIDFNKLVVIIKHNWFWIALIFILINTAAYLFVRYTKNVYESESQLKLDIKSNASELGIKTMIEDQNLNIVSGEIEMIQSTLFLNRVLDFTDFEVNFFSVGRVLNEELYLRAPAKLTIYSNQHSLYNVPVTFEEINEEEFELELTGSNPVRARYGRRIKFHDLELSLERNSNFARGDEVGYFFVINSRDALLGYLAGNLTVEPLNYNANTIRISFKGHNPYKAQAVLNKIDTLYLQYSNEQKNLVNKQKIDWLVNELGQIERKMENYEDYFENFTLENKTNDLDEDLRETIKAINSIDSQRYYYTRRVADLSTLTNGLKNGELKVSYANRQLLPQEISKMIDELAKLRIAQDKLKLSYNEVTFAYRQKQKEIETIQTTLVDQFTELRDDATKKLKDLTQRKISLEREFALLPDKNTAYSKNQRFYKLYEELYLMLMQSKSEFEIAQAGSIPDFKILSPASLPVVPISPKRLMIAGVGVVASITVIFFFIGILYLLNNKITNLYEVEKLDKAPLLGSVPQMRFESDTLHVVDYPKSRVSEAIRSLRTNLDFFQTNAIQKIIAVSSTVSGEGKSFIAMNLGAMIALSKKKVILLDLDMRKPKTLQPTQELDATKGVSTILIRRNRWEECLTMTSVPGFDFIPSGPHPPNPAELLMNGEFSELLSELKNHYDYIILDTPPVGLVTDGIMAMKRADLSIYVFRANYSKKEFLASLQRLIRVNKFSNITTVLNAVPVSNKTYGYGYYEENASRNKLKSILKR